MTPEIWALCGGLILQLFGAVYFFGALSARVSNLETITTTHSSLVADMATIKAQLALLIPEMERVRNRLDNFLDVHTECPLVPIRKAL